MLSSRQRRGIIARYGAVLEGNFIYWMTGAYLASKSQEARAIVLENLREEVRDSHPEMLRRFLVASDAVPNDQDAAAVRANLSRVRLFLGRLSGPPVLAMMAFFEYFIQRFMPYLAESAAERGSTEFEYTIVHGICDVGHSEELLRAVAAEIQCSSSSGDQLFEGVRLLEALIEDILTEPAAAS
jgi:Iron-containing redox enzyme